MPLVKKRPVGFLSPEDISARAMAMGIHIDPRTLIMHARKGHIPFAQQIPGRKRGIMFPESKAREVIKAAPGTAIPPEGTVSTYGLIAIAKKRGLNICLADIQAIIRKIEAGKAPAPQGLARDMIDSKHRHVIPKALARQLLREARRRADLPMLIKTGEVMPLSQLATEMGFAPMSLHGRKDIRTFRVGNQRIVLRSEAERFKRAYETHFKEKERLAEEAGTRRAEKPKVHKPLGRPRKKKPADGKAAKPSAKPAGKTAAQKAAEAAEAVQKKRQAVIARNREKLSILEQNKARRAADLAAKRQPKKAEPSAAEPVQPKPAEKHPAIAEGPARLRGEVLPLAARSAGKRPPAEREPVIEKHPSLGRLSPGISMPRNQMNGMRAGRLPVRKEIRAAEIRPVPEEGKTITHEATSWYNDNVAGFALAGKGEIIQRAIQSEKNTPREQWPELRRKLEKLLYG